MLINALFHIIWCGRRDSNPHTQRARDFKSRASTNFATSASRPAKRMGGRASSPRVKESRASDVQALAHFLAGLEIGDALGVHGDHFAGARVAAGAGVAGAG